MNQQLLIIESVCMCLASCDDLATHPGCTTLPTKPLICMCIVSLVYPVIFILLEHNRLHRSFHFLSLSQPCIFKCQERWPWSFYCTENLLHILQGIQSTGGFINTDLEPCLPSSIRVTCQWQRIQAVVHFPTFFHPHQACPYCHPASSMRSVTSPLRSANSIQPCSPLAPFLFLYSLEQGLTVTRESQEEAKKESLTYNNIFCMCIFVAWLFSLLDVVV